MEKVNTKTYVKKVQRRVNALIRRYNEALEEDDLWKGRFYIQQLRRDVWRFEDGSGASVSFLFEMVDKKTGKRDIFRVDNYDLRVAFQKNNGGAWKIFDNLNDFIVKTVDVWSENPPPRRGATQDFRFTPRLGQIKLSQLRYYLY